MTVDTGKIQIKKYEIRGKGERVIHYAFETFQHQYLIAITLKQNPQFVTNLLVVFYNQKPLHYYATLYSIICF